MWRVSIHLTPILVSCSTIAASLIKPHAAVNLASVFIIKYLGGNGTDAEPVWPDRYFSTHRLRRWRPCLCTPFPFWSKIGAIILHGTHWSRPKVDHGDHALDRHVAEILSLSHAGARPRPHEQDGGQHEAGKRRPDEIFCCVWRRHPQHPTTRENLLASAPVFGLLHAARTASLTLRTSSSLKLKFLFFSIPRSVRTI